MRRTACGLLTVTLVAAACAGGEAEPVERVALADAPPAPTEAPATTSSSSSTTTTSITTTTTPTVDDREAEILAVIDLYIDVFVEGMNPPDPEYGLWETVTIGAELEHVRRLAAERLQAGRGTRHRDEPHPLVTRAAFLLLETETALIDICVVDDTLVYDIATGEIVDDEIRYAHLQVAVEHTADGWRVARALLIDRFHVESECGAAF